MNARRFNASNPRDRRPVYRERRCIGYTERNRTFGHVWHAIGLDEKARPGRCGVCDGYGRDPDPLPGEWVVCPECRGSGDGRVPAVYACRDDAEERLRLDDASRPKDSSRP